MASPPPNSLSSSSPSLYLQDMDQVRQVFDRFDSDGDGRISSQELLALLHALGSHTSSQEVTNMMQATPTNETGHINLQEFAAFCSAESDPYKGTTTPAGHKELREAFDLYDQDHNGNISPAELHQVLTRLREPCSLHDCAAMIQSVDSTGDGYVSFDEFRKMMTNNKK